MKSLFKNILVLALVLTFFRVTFAEWIPGLQSPSADLPVNENYEPTQSRFSYDALASDKARQYYKVLKKEVYSYPEGDNNLLCSFTLNDESEMIQMDLAQKAFLEDHPDVFWFCEGSNLLGTRRFIYSRYPGKELKDKKENLKKEVKRFLDSVPKGLEPEELERYTHDYLLKNCDYDYEALSKDGNEDKDYSVSGEAYGVLVSGAAVCSGYSKAYQLLLNRLGVDCVCISGRPRGGSDPLKLVLPPATHMWNCVKNGSEWLMTDVTWDDADGSYKYEYFNLSKKAMFETHYSQAVDQSRYKWNRFFDYDLYGYNIFVPA